MRRLDAGLLDPPAKRRAACRAADEAIERRHRAAFGDLAGAPSTRRFS